MKLYIVVPMHNYAEGVERIADWFSSSEILGQMEQKHLVVVDDHSRPAETARARAAVPDVITVSPETRGKLRLAYGLAASNATALGCDAVLTCETDAVPVDDTLDAMLRVFQDPLNGWSRQGEVVSVSPVYTWQGRSCYPSQPTWFTPNESTKDCFEVQQHSTVGRIGLTAAVPFLFALWKPSALSRIDSTMPVLYRLDTVLGETLWSEGKLHLRLLDHTIDHVGGGTRSRGA